MRQDDLAHVTSFRNHFVDTFSQRLLLVFVRRSGIEDQHLFRVVDDVAAGVSSRRPRRRAYGKAQVVRPKRDAAARGCAAAATGCAFAVCGCGVAALGDSGKNVCIAAEYIGSLAGDSAGDDEWLDVNWI